MIQYIQYPFSRLQKYLSDAFDIDFKYLSFRFSFPVYLSMLCYVCKNSQKTAYINQVDTN